MRSYIITKCLDKSYYHSACSDRSLAAYIRTQYYQFLMLRYCNTFRKKIFFTSLPYFIPSGMEKKI